MKSLLIILSFFICQVTISQELYVSTEPASNMASGALGARVSSKLYRMNHNGAYTSYRIDPEIMLGVSKNFMIHLNAYGSNMFQKKFRFEGAGLYGKYRFFSKDDVHAHFRIAAFAKASVIKNPEYLITTAHHLFPDGMGGFVQHEEELHLRSNDLDLDGNNSGVSGGIVATQLKNKLALSASVAYAHRMNNIGHTIEIFQPLNAINYSTSAGLLLFPKNYTSYKQTNMNLYVEVLGQSFIDKKQYYIDVAPAIQFIFNSIARMDVGYRTQFSGNVTRLGNSNFMLRLEYNWLNVFAKK